MRRGTSGHSIEAYGEFQGCENYKAEKASLDDKECGLRVGLLYRILPRPDLVVRE